VSYTVQMYVIDSLFGNGAIDIAEGQVVMIDVVETP